MQKKSYKTYGSISFHFMQIEQRIILACVAYTSLQTDTVASCTYKYICIMSALQDVDLIDLMIPLAFGRKAS